MLLDADTTRDRMPSQPIPLASLDDLVDALAQRLAELRIEPKQWFTAAEAGAYLGYHEKTIHRLSGPNVVGPDRLPCHRLTAGGEKRFSRAELDEHLRQR
jgi:hypothetical protein